MRLYRELTTMRSNYTEYFYQKLIQERWIKCREPDGVLQLKGQEVLSEYRDGEPVTVKIVYYIGN